jgi:hypothetical protein
MKIFTLLKQFLKEIWGAKPLALAPPTLPMKKDEKGCVEFRTRTYINPRDSEAFYFQCVSEPQANKNAPIVFRYSSVHIGLTPAEIKELQRIHPQAVFEGSDPSRGNLSPGQTRIWKNSKVFTYEQALNQIINDNILSNVTHDHDISGERKFIARKITNAQRDNRNISDYLVATACAVEAGVKPNITGYRHHRFYHVKSAEDVQNIPFTFDAKQVDAIIKQHFPVAQEAKPAKPKASQPAATAMIKNESKPDPIWSWPVETVKDFTLPNNVMPFKPKRSGLAGAFNDAVSKAPSERLSTPHIPKEDNQELENNIMHYKKYHLLQKGR